MNLFLTAQSERGKPVSKSGNEAIIAEVLDKNRDKLITLHITAAHSHLQGAHYNIYLQNHQSEYIDIKNEK